MISCARMLVARAARTSVPSSSPDRPSRSSSMRCSRRILRSGSTFSALVAVLDVQGFETRSDLPISVSIASGAGTLSGTTTVRSTDLPSPSFPWYSIAFTTVFDNLVIQGTGDHTLRFSAPGLPNVVSPPINVTAAP